jgi:hypothetical protein
MDVTKAPLFDATANRAGATAASQQNAAPSSSGGSAQLDDRVDIQPLDLTAALQILVAEVRADLELPAAALVLQSPPQTAQIVIQMLLAAVPEEAADLPSWSIASSRVEAAVHTALNRAVEAVAVWRNVPQGVVDAARETRALVLNQLSDEPPGPMWLRPEWLLLAPQMRRFWRRRRRARQDLTDPDSRPSSGSDAQDAIGSPDDRHLGDPGGDRSDPLTRER